MLNNNTLIFKILPSKTIKLIIQFSYDIPLFSFIPYVRIPKYNVHNNNEICFYHKNAFESLKKYSTFNDIMGGGILIVIIVTDYVLCNS